MRLLYLTPRFPHPSAKGDQLAAYHRTVHLARRHEISLVSFYEHDGELEHLDELRALCASVQLVRHPRRRGVANVLRRAPFTTLPLQILYYGSSALRAAVAELTPATFDVAHAFMLRMWPYAGALPVPSVLDALDSMELRMRRNVEVERPPARWLFRSELRRVGPYERTAAASADAVIVVAEQDREAFGVPGVDVVPNGVDADAFAPDVGARTPNTVVFSGTMSYPPNVRAAVWFANECLPLVRAHAPEARFVIAGTAPAREVRELARLPGVVVTGRVESMPETLNAASVAVAPMLSGAGIQNKILEAMSCGLPLVTTPVGLAGIAAEPGTELVVAEGPEPFGAAVGMLLADPSRARALGAAARARIVASYTWERAAQRVEQIYERIVTR